MQESSMVICSVLPANLLSRRQSQNHTQLQTPSLSEPTAHSEWKRCSRCTDGRGYSPWTVERSDMLHRNHSYAHSTMRGWQL